VKDREQIESFLQEQDRTYVCSFEDGHGRPKRAEVVSSVCTEELEIQGSQTRLHTVQGTEENLERLTLA
jgi:hypothetical protein